MRRHRWTRELILMVLKDLCNRNRQNARRKVNAERHRVGLPVKPGRPFGGDGDAPQEPDLSNITAVITKDDYEQIRQQEEKTRRRARAGGVVEEDDSVFPDIDTATKAKADKERLQPVIPSTPFRKTTAAPPTVVHDFSVTRSIGEHRSVVNSMQAPILKAPVRKGKAPALKLRKPPVAAITYVPSQKPVKAPLAASKLPPKGSENSAQFTSNTGTKLSTQKISRNMYIIRVNQQKFARAHLDLGFTEWAVVCIKVAPPDVQASTFLSFWYKPKGTGPISMIDDEENYAKFVHRLQHDEVATYMTKNHFTVDIEIEIGAV